MGLILFLLFTILLFKFAGSLFNILMPVLIFLFVITLIAHLWWLIFLIIPIMMFSGRNRRRPAKSNNNNNYDHDFQEHDN